MTNRNAQFLSVIDGQTRSAILQSIADDYGITPDQVFVEITDEKAEHLLEYLVEPMRSATSVIMQRRGF